MARTHFKGDKYTDEVIKERAERKGYQVVSIDRSKEIPYVYLLCKSGHKRESRADRLQSLRCSFCEGKKLTVSQVVSLIGAEGFSLAGDPKVTIDSYGNTFVEAATRLKVYCPNDHLTRFNIAEFRRNKRCTTCSGTIWNTGFSRSEEIIARALTYIGVSFERQHIAGEDFENVAIDFYLPEFEAIIEYDGAHHRYGRSDSSDEQTAEIKRKDIIRDTYAVHVGFTMYRIDHEEGGKSLIYALADILKDFIKVDLNDPYYDTIVREVFNECADRFGWLTYEEIKRTADLRLTYTLPKVREIAGVFPTVAARHFKWVYGTSKDKYLKSK